MTSARAARSGQLAAPFHGAMKSDSRYMVESVCRYQRCHTRRWLPLSPRAFRCATPSASSTERRPLACDVPALVRRLPPTPLHMKIKAMAGSDLAAFRGRPDQYLRASLLESDRAQTLALECHYSARELALRCQISQRQLQRVFRAELNCTPQVWLREERMQTAKRLLRSAATVKQVAYSLGFTFESHFCRDFKLRFGHCPSVELRLRASLGKEPSTG